MARLASLTSPKIRNRVIAAACLVAAIAAVLPASAQTAPRPTPARAPAARPATPAAPAAKANPLLPPPIAIDVFFTDLTLSPKAPGAVPAGFEPLVTPAEWQTYRDRFGTEVDNLTKLKPSGQIALAEKLIAAAQISTGPDALPMAVRRLLLVRAAAIAYRTKEGFPTADKAVTAYLPLMDKKSASQVGALWSVANVISRTAVTPKPDRIRYDGIAAKANMQLALLMLQVDQLDAAQAIIKQIAYHEGWLKTDPATRAMIAQVRAEVRQTAAMMDYLATQYQPAIRNDVTALTMVYLYGRYVKHNLPIVADLPGRVPDSHLAQLAASLDAAALATASGRGDLRPVFQAAEHLRMLAGSVPDGRLRSRTLYAAMQLYDVFMAAPQTERNRIERTLARIAREGVVTDGAKKGFTIDVFAPPPSPASAPEQDPPAPVLPSSTLAPMRIALGRYGGGEN